jgi:hypothetical protein
MIQYNSFDLELSNILMAPYKLLAQLSISTFWFWKFADRGR